jgi:4-alpha-glucanotransferase
VIVGEDLGTVEPGVRERLALRRMLSCRLLWFEARPPAEYPELSKVGDEPHQLRDRLRQMLGVASAAPIAEVIEAAYRHLGGAPSRIITATLEDAQGMVDRPNMPGTTDERPNWSIPLPQDIETMVEAELPRRIASALGRRV